MSRCWGGGRRQPADGSPTTPPRGTSGRHRAASRRDAAAGHAIISVLLVALVVLAVVLLLALAGGLTLPSASPPGPAHRPEGSDERDRFPPVGAPLPRPDRPALRPSASRAARIARWA